MFDIEYDEYVSYDGIIGTDDDFVEEGLITQEELDEEREARSKLQAKKEVRPTIDDVSIPQRRIAEIMKGYDSVVVHDFGDMYHLSEEERQASSQFYGAFKKVQKMKNKYKNVPKYITALRAAFECLDNIAENNGVYPPEKFKKMYFKGDIEITGLEFPVYTRKDRKNINWDEVLDFVHSDRDPEDWNRATIESTAGDTLDERISNMFEDNEIEAILNAQTSSEVKDAVNSFYSSDDPNDIWGNIATPLSRKEERSMRDLLRTSARILQRNMDEKRRLSTMIYDLNESDFDAIEKYDRKHGFVTSMTEPEFKGNIMSEKDVSKFLSDVDEYESGIQEEYHGKLYTRAEIQEMELKGMFEEAGINILALYDNRKRKKRLNQAAKRDKIKERRLRKSLEKIDARRKRRMGEDEDGKKKKKKHR